MKRAKHAKLFFITFLLILLYILFTMLRPLFSALLLSLVISFVFYPLYRWFYKKTKSENISAIILCVLILVIIIVPSILLAGLLVNQSYNVYLVVKDKMAGGNLISSCNEGILCNAINSVLNRHQLSSYLNIAMEKVTGFIVANGSSFVKGISSMVITIFILVLSMFYFFKDGVEFVRYVEGMIPLPRKYSNEIIHQFERIVYAAIHGNLITAIAQGFLGLIGFLIVNSFFYAKIQTPLLWAALMALFALIPIVGTAIIWLPMVIIQFAMGNNVSAVVLLVYCVLFVSTIDNYIKPKIISRSIRLHPLLVFLSVVGGLITFGFIGLLLGPLVLAILTVFIQLYEEEYKKEVM